MDCGARILQRIQQKFLGHTVITLGVGGWHATFVHPKQVNGGPIDLQFHQFLEKQFRGGATGNGNANFVIFAINGADDFGDAISGGSGCSLWSGKFE